MNNELLKQILNKINPPEDEINKFNILLNEFIKKLKNKIKESEINAEIFVGGSFAKKTIIKKEFYDVDIFMRFDKKHSDISKLTKQILKDFNPETIHGSRDYFRVKAFDNFYLEIVPVLKVTKPENSENITDLSYMHVNYINKKIKSRKILDEIKIAKAFCQAQGIYGAESYIKGFSGYALELLIYYYKSFEKFLKEMLKVKDKLIIDIEKQFKNKKNVMLDLNSSKLDSPIILIDPTYKHRNALAALSNETFKKFQNSAQEFLKNPSIKFFEKQKIDLNKIKEDAKKKKQQFILVEAKTNKPAGDVAGGKLIKFFKLLEKEIEKYFKIQEKGFNYNKKQSARYYFVVKPKKEIIFTGPYLSDKKNSKKFQKEHSKILTKHKRLYAIEKINFSLKQFLKKWKRKNKKLTREMYIKEIKIL